MMLIQSLRGFIILAVIACLLASQPVAAEGVYKGRLVYVLGDVKQGQIQNKLDTKAKIDSVLLGLEKLGCNGVRITIFPEGENPNPEMFDYLYQQAKERKFKIFANPAQHAGAQRLANRDIQKPGGVKNQMESTRVLLDRLHWFAENYPCDWINPFNEDGAPDKPWTVKQIDFIYRNLHGKVNGAELVGPCTWGIPAGLKMLDQTNISQYITVATTHNLGHHHQKWPDFIRAARRLNLPVWDSEVNTHKKFPGKPHRLDAALAADVDGLVLYHAWKSYVNLKTGELNNAGKNVRAMVLLDENRLPHLGDGDKPVSPAAVDADARGESPPR